MRTYWVLERLLPLDISRGYWTAHGSKLHSLTYDVTQALQFARREDAVTAMQWCPWPDARPTEHIDL